MNILNIPISIPEETKTKAELLARSSKTNYGWRGQYNEEKIIRDIMNGKIAEEMSYRILRNYYPDISPPDYEIYAKKDKNYNPDLVGNISFAVKTQEKEAERIYGRSWVFEITDKEIFERKNENLYVVLTSIDISNMVFYIRGIV